MVVAAKALAVLRVFAVVAALNLPSVLLFSLEVYGNFGGALILRSLVAHAAGGHRREPVDERDPGASRWWP